MTKYVTAFFAVGIAAMVAIGLSAGLDAAGVLLLALAACVALVGVAVARKFSGGSVEPALCASCGGVIAPSSPYCKHCGAPR